jgi:multicomponent Na+:H+ antiporter subunit G
MVPLIPYVADVLVLFGVLIMTVGVYGVARLPDTYLKLHAAGKMVFLGAMSLLLASALTAGEKDVVLRVILIAFFFVVTTPVSAHMVARAAYLRGEKMHPPEALDESGRDLGATDRVG